MPELDPTQPNPDVINDWASRLDPDWGTRKRMSEVYAGETFDPLKHRVPIGVRPRIVCLCGSTRFKDAFVEAQLRETLAGKIVLTIGCDLRSDVELFGHLSDEELIALKVSLDALHLRKIDLADEVLILNVGGYIGESTSRELQYALYWGKTVRYLVDPLINQIKSFNPPREETDQ